MRAAEDNHPASTAEGIGQAVNVACVGRIAGDSHQIGWRVETDRLVVFIDNRDLVRRVDKPSQVRHRELRKVVELPPAKSLDEAVLGGNQQDAQGMSLWNRFQLKGINAEHIGLQGLGVGATISTINLWRPCVRSKSPSMIGPVGTTSGS